MSRLAIAAACLVWPIVAWTQDQPITRVTVNQVRIDAVVTDRQGDLVRDLTKADFSVFQDRKRQSPIHVQFVSEGEARGSGAAASAARELKREEVQRTIVAIIDDANMSFESFVQSRQALKKYLDQAMRPGDMAAVLCTSRSSSFLSQFSSDPVRIRLAIDQMSRNVVSRAEWGPLVNTVNSTLWALNRMPGRKSVIIFCERLRIRKNSAESSMDALRKIVDSSLRSSVRIYGIDPRGLHASPSATLPNGTLVGLAYEQAREGRGVEDRAAQMLNRQDRGTEPVNFEDNEGLAFLAGETGGLMLEGTNDLGKQLQTALRDQSGYYLVAWDPGDKAFKPSKGHFADYHSIKITVDRPGVKVRTFRGFYGFDRADSTAFNRSPRMTMQEALLSPFQNGEINVRLNSQFDLAGDKAFIRSFVDIDGKDIVFQPVADAARKDCSIVNLEVLTLPQPVDWNVEMLSESQMTSLEVCGSAREQMQHDGLAITMLHPVTKPGAYQMRLAVRNLPGLVVSDDRSLTAAPKHLMTRAESDPPVGSAHVLVQAPDWSTKPALFGIRLQSARQPVSLFQQRSGSPKANSMMLGYRSGSQGDPAVRHFQPGETFYFNAKLANVTGAQAEIRIWHADEAGAQQEIYSGAATIASGGTGGSYRIPESLAPGTYYLRIIAKGEGFQASEDIDFTVSAR